MARAAAVICGLVAVACSNNPYVIGRAFDAGTTDGGVADSGAADAGAAACPPAALLCSGFEQPAFEPEWSGTELQNDGVVERSTARAHRGVASLHATSSRAMSMAVVSKDFPALRSGSLYVRLYAYVAGALPTHTVNFLFVGELNMSEPFVGVDLNLENGAVQVFSPQGDPTRQTGTTLVPRDRWFCLRASIAIAEQGGRVEVHVEDAVAVVATDIDTLPPGGVREFRAGIDWSSEQGEFFEIYLDDIAVDTKPVACID